MNTSGTVIISVVVMAGTTMIGEAATGKVTMGPIIYGFMLGSALMLIGFASPQLAKTLAIMGVVGVMVTQGPKVVKVLGGIRGA